jgi:pilus assembly protein Flp/PilA
MCDGSRYAALSEKMSPKKQQKLTQFYAFGFINGNLSLSYPFVKLEGHPMFRQFLRDERGATAIEYSLIAGFIALAIIAAVGMTGQRLVTLFESLIPALTR